MKKAEVFLTPRAEGHACEISAWWRANRSSSPTLFVQELRGAINILEQSPDVGRRYQFREIGGLRRLLLPRTRYHIYYVHDETVGRVLILAVWSAVRGLGPDLSRSTD
jgi:plasmid stabilization system protein ParE